MTHQSTPLIGRTITHQGQRATPTKSVRPKLGPPRPFADGRLELTREYVLNTPCRAPGSIEARLMRDWLRMYDTLCALGKPPEIEGGAS